MEVPLDARIALEAVPYGGPRDDDWNPFDGLSHEDADDLRESIVLSTVDV